MGNSINLSVVDVINESNSNDEAMVKIFKIMDLSISSGLTINLSFKDVDEITLRFLYGCFGKLYKTYSGDMIMALVNITNLDLKYLNMMSVIVHNNKITKPSMNGYSSKKDIIGNAANRQPFKGYDKDIKSHTQAIKAERPEDRPKPVLPPKIINQ